MQRNTTLIAGLMLVLALVAGWALLGNSGGLSSSVDASSKAMGQGGADALLGPILGPEAGAATTDPAGRVEVVVHTPPSAAAGLDLVPAERTEVVGRTVDASGKPLPGAKLELWATTRQVQKPEEAEAFAAHLEALSGPDGRFHIQGIPGRGTYLYLAAEAPGAARAELFGFDARPGRVRDVGDVELGPPARLFGVVLDDHDQPLGGASIWLTKGSLTSSRVRGVAEPAGFADGTGRFQLLGLGSGSYVVGAEAPGRALTFSDVIQVKPGGLPPSEVTLRLEEGYTLRGRVVDGASETGIGDAALRLQPANANNAQYFELTTDAGGSFEFAGLGIGARLRVVADKDGYLTANQTIRPQSATAGQLEERVKMYPERTLTLTVLDDASGEPIAGAGILGSGNNPSALRPATMAGFATHEGDTPLAVTDELGLASLPLGRSDPWLTVTAEGYAPQTVANAPRAPRDTSSATDMTLEVRLTRGAALVVRVTAGGVPEAAALVELRIASSEPGRPPGSGPAPPSPRSPRNGRREQPRRVSQDLLWRDEIGMTPVARATTDEAGEALFGSLPMGIYYVDVLPPDPALQASLMGPARIFADSERTEFLVELGPAATITGRVLDHEDTAEGHRVLAMRSLDEKPVAPGRRLPQVAEQVSTITDAEGRFQFDGLAAGTWKLVSFRPLSLANLRDPVHGAAAISFQLQEGSLMVDLVGGESREVELQAQSAGARLRGRVMVNHRPRAGVQVRGSFQDGEGNRQSFRAQTDSTGRYEADALLPGTWSISASLRATQSGNRRVFGSDVTVARGDLQVPDQPEVAFDVDVEVGSVAIQVGLEDPEVPAGEEPKELAKVSWVSISFTADTEKGGVAGLPDGTITSAWTSVDEWLVVDNLPAGAYQVRITGYGAEQETLDLRIAPGVEARLEGSLVRQPKDQVPDFNWFE